MQEVRVGLEAIKVGKQREVPRAHGGGLITAGLVVLCLDAAAEPSAGGLPPLEDVWVQCCLREGERRGSGRSWREQPE